jgi:hypothetical protein
MSQKQKLDWSVVPLLEAGLLGPGRISGVTAEIVAGAALLKAKDGRAIVDHVVEALWQRLPDAALDAVPADAQVFYRMSALERALLLLLHRARWPYERIAPLLKMNAEQVEELAWSTRLRLAYSPDRLPRLTHPTGSPVLGASCPEYHPAAPWTQRWLDERIAGRDRAFLQTHLERCEPCREALNRAREVYYAVDRCIPRVSLQPGRERQLNRVFFRTRYLRNPTEQSVLSSLADGLGEVLSRPRVLIGVVLILALSAWLDTWVRG